MPAGPRIRANNVYGTISDNPMLIGAVSFTSLGLSLLPDVSGQHAVIVIDPKRTVAGSNPEIVVVTSHLAMGTTATVTRAQYGTVAREWPAGTAWAHVPIDEDYIEILTAATRPLNPYEGQFIFETDTNKLVGYGGVDWAPRDAGGSIGYAKKTTTQGSITTETDLTGLTVSVTVGTGRLVKVSCFVPSGRSIGDGVTRIHLKEGVTILQIMDGFPRIGNEAIVPIQGWTILTPSAGVHTYKLSMFLLSGTGTVTQFGDPTYPSFILVEDIGAA